MAYAFCTKGQAHNVLNARTWLKGGTEATEARGHVEGTSMVGLRIVAGDTIAWSTLLLLVLLVLLVVVLLLLPTLLLHLLRLPLLTWASGRQTEVLFYLIFISIWPTC